ncbi:hypothetical protein [Chitinophaga filiformis]|uniref:Uncharacterized protein n=1 Tax=Chitinophaga filiformis TaxID=104663 RepID=A0A1G7MK81_CHIFI|nr:hypothetical protein [Chitinophaga filiformis]SDF61510.1 hypothetical protein SAMN04488121_102446 [Chitinophaga filiformis]
MNPKISVFLCTALVLQVACANLSKKHQHQESAKAVDSLAIADAPSTETSMWPDSIASFLSNGANASISKLSLMKPGDTAYVDYAPCLLQDGRPATFCIKAPEDIWIKTKDPQFSWNVQGEQGWAHADNLTYQTATQGVWETDCHAERQRNGSREYYNMWLENGTPGNAHHRGGTPKFKDKDGNVWMLGERVVYTIGSGKHLSTMILIKTSL